MGETAPDILSKGESVSSRSLSGWIMALQAAVLAVLLYFTYRLPILSMINTWLTDGNWSHGWLVPVFSLYFLGVHRNELARAPRRASVLGFLVVVGALGFYYYFSLKRYGYPQQVTLIPCLMGLVLFVGGWKVLRVAWFPVAYLLFAVPLPTWLYFNLTLPLRQIASQTAGMVLGLLPNVFTEVQGLVIDYMYLGRPGSLNVEEACSGMRLMMAFCALGVAMAYLGDRPVWHRIVMVTTCVPIAVFCNTLRVIATGVLHVYGKEDLSQGTAHELLGLVMLPIALGLFSLVGYVLNNLYAEEEPSNSTDASPARVAS